MTDEPRFPADLLNGIVENALDAIVSVDARLNVVLFNDAAARMFGVPREQAIGQPLDRFIPPEHRSVHRHYMQEYAATGTTTRVMGTARCVEGLRANGERFPMEASISRAGGQGERMVLTVMARDLTQLRQAEETQLARAAAEAASRAKTRFLSRMSHELRTLLNAVLGFAQILRTESPGPLTTRQREQLDLMLQAGNQLCALIGEMLEVAQKDSNQA